MSNPPLPATRRLTSELIGRLTNDIVTGKAAPNTRLPTEHALMDTFGVSRTVVREAIAALRADGLVETRRGAGAFVTADLGRRPFRIDPNDLQTNQQILDVMELRICVEVEAAGLAARRRSSADVAKLRRICRQFAAAIDAGDEAMDLDFEFHAAIGAATGNPYFSSFLRFLGHMIIPRRRRYADRTVDPGLARYLRRLHREHEVIARAIAARDVAGARRAMRSHLKRGRERYRPARPGAR
jgi:GntR family transcriptional repressor for pyruvate dehydrogenase complex